MRNILFVLIALISGYSVIYGQTFNLNATNTGTTQTTCNATLYDSGGPSGTYQNSENYSITFCSGTTDCMQIQFLGTFQVEAGWDEVNIYDGSSIAAPLLASLDGSTLPPSYTSSTPCITIQFTSDGSVTQAGFQANIVCTPNCYVPPPPPTNIGPCSATAVTVNSNCIYTTYTNVSAPGSGIPMPSCSWSYMGGDVWFEAVVPASGLLEVSVSQGTVTEAGMAIYSGPDCNNLTEILCNEPWAMPFLLTVPSGLGLAGQTVWIRIWEQNNDNQGTFDLCVYEPPPSIEVDITTYTPEELVLDILVTGCLQADNVVYTGDPQAIGYFYNAYGVGIQEGVIMSSGYVMNAPGHGNNTFTSDMLTTSGGDPLLNAIVTPDVTTDVTILEFDFIPSSDSLTFDFIFGSEEYPEYVFSFNDVFAFFLSGTNPGGGNYVNQNIALIPGTTTPVSIYNVNNGSGSPPTGPCVNCQYYVDNWAGTYAITYDGYTTPITARAWVVPCQTYHIKLAVADVNDMAFDSAVLLKAGSFSSGGQVTMNNYESSGVQSNQIIEGCTNYWVFSRLDTLDLTDTIFVDLILSGTADTATDFNNFSSQFYILPGQIYDTLFYSAIMDNLPEGTEYIVFTVVNGCPCSTTTQSDTIWVIDNFSLQPTITPNSQICSSNNFTVNTTVNPALPSGFVSYIWSTGDSTASITVSPPTTTTYTVTITHTCMPDTALSMTLTVIPDLGAGFMSSVPGACIGDPITFTFTDTASVNVVYQWTFTNGTPASGNTQGPYTVTWNAAGTYDISLHVDDNGCVGDSTITVDIWPNPQVSFTPVDALCYNSCDGSITANPLGTSTPYTYIWDDPMAQTTQTASNLCAGTFNVTFTNSDGCVGTSSSSISQPAQLTSTISGVNVLCFGGNNGSASLTPAGGIQPYTYLWSDGQTTQDASGLVAGTYTATVTDDNGCTVTQSIVIQGPASPLSASLTSNDISCYGYTDGNIDLTVTGGTVPYSYAWNTGQTIQDITNAPAGNYSVVITDNNGCTTTQAVVITQPTELIYTTSVTDATCWGQSDGVVTISVSQGTPPYTYIWSNGMSGYSLMNVPGGTYSVTATDNNGCTVTETLFVDEPDKVIAAASPDKWICIGQSVILNTSATGGNPGYTYHWSTGGTGSTLTVNPVVTTQYWVYAEDVNSCVSSKEYITVNVFLPISVDVSINETEICPGEAVVISAHASGGNGHYTYTVHGGSVIYPPWTDFPNESMSYTIIASDDCGSPTDQGTVNVDVLTLPPISFAPDTIQGCQPLTVHFIENSPDIGQTFLWDFDDLNSYNTSNKKNPTHVFEEAGVYTITLTVTSAEGCVISDVVEDLITVYPIPDADFRIEPDIVSVINPMVFFHNNTVGGQDFHWMFGDGDSSLLENPYHLYAALPQSYLVELIVTSDHGCRDTVYYDVKVKDEYTFYAPTAFSPDGDNNNDRFFIMGHGIDANEYLLIIYDRWGEVIFETKDPNASWDGRAKSGNKKCPIGTYTWIATFKDQQGIEHQETGAVTIIR